MTPKKDMIKVGHTGRHVWTGMACGVIFCLCVSVLEMVNGVLGQQYYITMYNSTLAYNNRTPVHIIDIMGHLVSMFQGGSGRSSSGMGSTDRH